jgi:hypothetical protein
MRSLSLLVAFSISLAGVQAADQGTNCAGTTRKWAATGLDSPYNTPFDAEFVKVANGTVWLSHSREVTRSLRDLNGRWFKQKGQESCQIGVPLAHLSASDRKWVEENNPCETCLTEKSRAGAIGTLAWRRGGFYRVTQVAAADEVALVDFVHGDPTTGKVVWSFELHSKLVPSLNVGEYKTISPSLVPGFDKLPPRDKEQYGVDFTVARRSSKTKKKVDVVSDNR